MIWGGDGESEFLYVTAQEELDENYTALAISYFQQFGFIFYLDQIQQNVLYVFA